MFGRGKKTGEVGINKEADREIILWITKKVIETIQAKQYTKLKNEKLENSEEINNYTISAANKIWKGVPVSTICTKFLKAYTNKSRSESKNLILPYFEALKAVLNATPKTIENKLPELIETYRKLKDNQIANRRALLNLSKGTGSKLKTAMNQQLTQMDEILQKTKPTEKEKATEKEIELDQTKFFELLNEKIGLLGKYRSWAILDGFGDDLNLIISYFEKAYLSGEKLTITHPTYSCEAVTNDCLLRAYPVLKGIFDKIKEKHIEDSRFENLNTFLKGAYDGLEEESDSMYEPESAAPEGFDQDLNTVMLLLS